MSHWILFPDGAYYNLATDVAALPTGRYGKDWVVVRCDSGAAPDMGRRWCRDGKLPYSVQITAREARRLFSERPIESGNELMPAGMGGDDRALDQEWGRRS